MFIENRKAISRTVVAIVIVVILVIAAVAAIIVLRPTTPSTNTTSYKLALVIGGDETDVGLNANGVEVAQWIQSTYGWNVSISRDVAYSDQSRVITTYAQEGYDVVWTDGNQFIGTTEQIAAQFPNVTFIMSPTYDGDNLTSNVVAVGAGYQATGYYLAGVLAGKMTQTNATGVIIGQWFAALSFEFYAYQAGVHSVNPSAKVYLTVPGTWSDPTIGYTVANEMITSDHVDIIVPIADATGRGVIAAATTTKVENVSIIGTVEDQVTLAPNNMMTSVLLNTTAFMQMVIERFSNGTWSQIGGKVLDMNLGSLAPFHAYDSIIPASVKTLLADTSAGIDNGTIQVPFTYTQNPPATP
jgi:basic membrane protein A